MNKTFTLKIIRNFKRLLFISTFIVTFISIESFTKDLSNPTGLQPKIVKCYPNPAISFINFEFPADAISKDYFLSVYSFTGKKMYESTVANTKLTLAFTNEFYRGIYVYQFTDKGGKILETGKFQVTR